MKSHFVVWMVIKLHLVHIMSVDFIDEVSQALTHAPLGPTEKEFVYPDDATDQLCETEPTLVQNKHLEYMDNRLAITNTILIETLIAMDLTFRKALSRAEMPACSATSELRWGPRFSLYSCFSTSLQIRLEL